MKNQIILGDNQKILSTLPKGVFRLCYIDPPFDTKKTQKLHGNSYEDTFDDFEGFLMPRIEQALGLLTDNGSIMIHLDYRSCHYVKVAMDKLMGRDHFINEIIWSFDYGGRSKSKYSNKHNNILWYVKDPKNYIFNYDQLERIPYMAPGLCGPDKAAKGKTITSVIWNTIVPTQGPERQNYPTQKPTKLLNQFVKNHSQPGDYLLDFFAGSGSFCDSAAQNGRGFVGIDQNIEAVNIMARRLQKYTPELIGFNFTK